jgi:hypothetical protein
MRRRRILESVRCGALIASLLATLPATRGLAQTRPITKGQAAAVKQGTVPDTVIRATVPPQLLTTFQQRATPASWPAPQPCVGGPTITHGRHGDSIPLPELRKGTVQQAQAVLARMHLNVDSRSVDPRTVRMSVPPNRIVAQSPPTGTIVASGDTVIICTLTPPPTAPPVSVETSVVVVAPPPQIVQMPRLVGRSYATAVSMIRALPPLSRNRPRVTARGVNGQPFEPTRSLVDSQRPATGAVLTAQDAIEVVFRDTTTLLVFTPPQQQPQTPAAQPQTQPQPILTQPQFQPPPQSSPPPQAQPAEPQSQPRTQRQSQQPQRAEPTLPTVTMPLVTGRMYDAAADTLRKLIQLGALALTPGRRGINGTRFTAARSVVDSQLPTAGTVLTRQSVVLFIVRDTLTNGPPLPRVASITTHRDGSPLWKWIIAAGVLLAVAATAVAVNSSRHQKARARLAALQVIPHLDVGRPRVVFTVRDGERPEDAFARVGLSIRAVADPGKPLLHFPRPPRTRDEPRHV